MTARWLALPAWTLLAAAAATAQAQTFDADAAQARCRWLLLGSYQRGLHGIREPDADDVVLLTRTLAQTDAGLRVAAAQAAATLAREPFFLALTNAARRPLVQALLAQFEGDDVAAGEAAARALGAFAPGGSLAGEDLRRTVAQALAMLLRPDVEVRRFVALLLEALAPVAGLQEQQEIARTVLLALERYPPRDGDDERARIARSTLAGVLTRLQPDDVRLADDLAQRWLADLRAGDRWGFHYERWNALHGLAQALPRLRDPRRAEAWQALLATVGDPDLRYMATSGRQTPLRHHGHEALLRALPALTADERRTLRARVAQARTVPAPELSAADREGIFGALERALADTPADRR